MRLLNVFCVPTLSFFDGAIFWTLLIRFGLMRAVLGVLLHFNILLENIASILALVDNIDGWLIVVVTHPTVEVLKCHGWVGVDLTHASIIFISHDQDYVEVALLGDFDTSLDQVFGPAVPSDVPVAVTDRSHSFLLVWHFFQ